MNHSNPIAGLSEFTIKLLVLNIFILLTICTGKATTATDTSFVEIPFAPGKIEVDGVLDDWKKYEEKSFADTSIILHTPEEWSFELTYDGLNPLNVLPPKSRNSVKAWYCWNFSGLYVAFQVEDTHLMAEITDGSDNPNIFLNDGIEIYIDSKCDSKTMMDINDYQFIVDVLANSIVFKGNRLLQDSATITVPKDYGQNIIIETATTFKGTINDTTGNDQGCIIEVRIPFEAIGIIPATGLKIKLDLCNNDNDYFLKAYNLSDPVKIITRPFNWSGLNNFGYPDYWKVAVLTGKPGWFATMSGNAKSAWVLTFIIVSIISIMVAFFLLFRIQRLKAMPSYAEVAPAKLLFIKQDNTENQSQTVNQQYLQKATDYISDNSHEILNSEDIASFLSISLKKFQRITKEELNCTPTNFIYIVKLNKAAEFIKNNQGNIAEAAYHFGFSSPSYFSKIFRNHFGVSPMEFKKSDNHLDNNDTEG